MPKETISTYATVYGNIKVEKIFSEEPVKPYTKQVSIFEKYSKKVTMSVKVKDTELTR